jgi:hypothetical protein
MEFHVDITDVFLLEGLSMDQPLADQGLLMSRPAAAPSLLLTTDMLLSHFLSSPWNLSSP